MKSIRFVEVATGSENESEGEELSEEETESTSYHEPALRTIVDHDRTTGAPITKQFPITKHVSGITDSPVSPLTTFSTNKTNQLKIFEKPRTFQSRNDSAFGDGDDFVMLSPLSPSSEHIAYTLERENEWAPTAQLHSTRRERAVEDEVVSPLSQDSWKRSPGEEGDKVRNTPQGANQLSNEGANQLSNEGTNKEALKDQVILTRRDQISDEAVVLSPLSLDSSKLIGGQEQVRKTSEHANERGHAFSTRTPRVSQDYALSPLSPLSRDSRKQIQSEDGKVDREESDAFYALATGDGVVPSTRIVSNPNLSKRENVQVERRGNRMFRNKSITDTVKGGKVKSQETPAKCVTSPSSEGSKLSTSKVVSPLVLNPDPSTTSLEGLKNAAQLNDSFGSPESHTGGEVPTPRTGFEFNEGTEKKGEISTPIRARKHSKMISSPRKETSHVVTVPNMKKNGYQYKNIPRLIDVDDVDASAHEKDEGGKQSIGLNGYIGGGRGPNMESNGHHRECKIACRLIDVDNMNSKMKSDDHEPEYKKAPRLIDTDELNNMERSENDTGHKNTPRLIDVDDVGTSDEKDEGGEESIGLNRYTGGGGVTSPLQKILCFGAEDTTDEKYDREPVPSWMASHGLHSPKKEQRKEIQIQHLHDCSAPPGPLGIIIENSGKLGANVRFVHGSSSLFGKILPGDRIVAIDGRDTTAMDAASVTRILARKSQQHRNMSVSRTQYLI